MPHSSIEFENVVEEAKVGATSLCCVSVWNRDEKTPTAIAVIAEAAKEGCSARNEEEEDEAVLEELARPDGSGRVVLERTIRFAASRTRIVPEE